MKGGHIPCGMVAESGWYHGARKPSSLAEEDEGFLFEVAETGFQLCLGSTKTLALTGSRPSQA